MKVIARTDEYTIYQKRSERYAVRGADRAWVNGAAKVAILLEHKLIDVAKPKAAAPEAAAPEADASAEPEAAGGEDAPAAAEEAAPGDAENG